MPTDTVTLREAVEQQLADLVANKPGFLEQLVVDPKGTIAPIIRVSMDDDGAVDLDGYDIRVHVAGPKTLDFVVRVGGEEAEVSGFSTQHGVGADMNLQFMTVLAPPRIGLPAQGVSCSGSDATCHTDSAKTNYCGGCR
jgi:hypothetical protein